MSRGRAPALVAGAALLVLGFYVVAYPLHGYRVGIGSDTPVYAWWARYAASAGLGGLGTGPRAGLVGPLAVLSTVLHVQAADLAAVLGPVLAVALALAAGALVDAALGRDRGRVVLTVVLTGTFLVLLVPGYLSTLAFGTGFVATLATMTVSLEERSWWPVGAAAALLCAAGLSHVLFLAPAAGILLGGLAALIGPSLREVRAGGRWVESPLGRTAAASVGGAVLVVGGLALEGALVPVLGGGSEGPVTARDTLLRRTGLGSMVRTSYRRKLLHDFSWYRALVTVGIAAVPFAWAGSRRTLAPGGRRGSSRRWFFVGVIAAWVAITLGGVVGLLIGLPSPGQRLAAFCLPLPILAAVGLSALVRRPSRRRTAGRVLLVVAVIGYGAVAWLAWNKEAPLEPPAALAQARAAGAALAGQPPGTPLILVIDDHSNRPSLFVVRALNHVRAAVPGDRVSDVHAFVGTPEDFLTGRPGLTGQAEHDAMAASFWADVAPARRPGAMAVSIQAFDPHRFGRVAALSRAARLAPGVVALPGFAGSSCGRACAPRYDQAGAGPISPWLPVWLAPVVLAILWLAGFGWSTATLRARRRVAALVAPAFGLAALGIAALVVDALGVRLDGAGGWTAALAAVGGGLVAAVARGGFRPEARGPDVDAGL